VTIKLHLGVVDVPYAHSTAPAAGKKPTTSPGSTLSTGDIAEILEARYGILNVFFEENAQAIADDMRDALQGKLEDILLGAPIDVGGELFSAGELGAIEEKFRKMLDNRGLDGKIAGVPTKAAQAGVSHRFLHPYAKRPSRPSFIDTGQYQAAFRVWATEE
jgi:hypothetical protein